MGDARSLRTDGLARCLAPYMKPHGHACDLAGLTLVALPPGEIDMHVSVGSSMMNVLPDGGLTTRMSRLNGSLRSSDADVLDHVSVISGGYELEVSGRTAAWDLTLEFDERRLGALAAEALDGGAIELPLVDEYRDRFTAALARRAIAHLRSAHVEPLHLDGLAVSILMRQVERSAWGGIAVPTGGTASRIERAIEYIEVHLHEPLSVARLSAVAAMSPAWFSSSLRARTGRSVYGWVNHRRLERARALLLHDKERSIADVALACGFSSPTHLTARFGLRYGITPVRWRAKAL